MSFLIGVSDILRVARLAQNFDDIPQDEFINSYLGTPIYDQLIYTKEDNPDIDLIEDFAITEMIINLSKTKRIVRTTVQGRDGDVNELINNNDFEINVQGLLISEDQLVQPIDAAKTLNKICDYKGSLAVSSNYLEAFDIDTVVIDSYDIGQERGFRNMIPFTLSMRSENPIELQIASS